MEGRLKLQKQSFKGRREGEGEQDLHWGNMVRGVFGNEELEELGLILGGGGGGIPGLALEGVEGVKGWGEGSVVLDTRYLPNSNHTPPRF